jgi:uncharacterized protein YndB with AHSA1/START domain
MTSVTLVRRIAARPSIVFDAVTTAEGMASWWGPDDGPVLAAESDVRIGGGYRVRFRTSQGIEHEASGEFLNIEKPRRVVMSFQWVDGGDPDEVGNISRVEFVLREIDGETELTFTHADLREMSKASHELGWSYALQTLMARMAG